jgi:uncharacterized membrane protein
MSPVSNFFLIRSCHVLTLLGNTLTVIGSVAIIFGIFGAFEMEYFSFGLSSGIRVIGSVAIAGCLLSAIGYGISDYINN